VCKTGDDSLNYGKKLAMRKWSSLSKLLSASWNRFAEMSEQREHEALILERAFQDVSIFTERMKTPPLRFPLISPPRNKKETGKSLKARFS
jgi:hypothetical protein